MKWYRILLVAALVAVGMTTIRAVSDWREYTARIAGAPRLKSPCEAARDNRKAVCAKGPSAACTTAHDEEARACPARGMVLAGLVEGEAHAGQRQPDAPVKGEPRPSAPVEDPADVCQRAHTVCDVHRRGHYHTRPGENERHEASCTHAASAECRRLLGK